ncbi:MAG: M48 family metalloprotease, partial [Patescibacteria group bacterium]|nr:M48 family metalloprotease [Patescibacteria group bacterium]
IILFLFSVLLARLAPVFLFPIFYKFSPIDDEELKNRISNLCETVKVRFTGIFKFNLSKNTKKANAGFTGIGKTKRIILSDTLLHGFNYDEIETVFAHELGHYKLRHIVKHIFIGLFLNFAGLFLSAKIYEYFIFTFNYSSISQLSALPLLSLILMFYGFITMPLSNFISRKFEFEADEFAVRLVNKPQAFISTMEKLSSLNLTDKSPNPVVEFIFYSHPSIEKRIGKINKLLTSNVENLAAENI